MKRRMIQLALAAIVLGGCNGNHETPDSSTALSQQVRDRLALCGAGVSSGIRAQVEAKVGKSLQEGGKLTADVEQAVRAAFFEGSDPSNATVEKAYEIYVGCVNRPL